jgi:hypothetical protein
MSLATGFGLADRFYSAPVLSSSGDKQCFQITIGLSFLKHRQLAKGEETIDANARSSFRQQCLSNLIIGYRTGG